MKYWLLIALFAGSVQAAPLATPGLLSTDIVRPLIDRDPEVAAARATREIAQQDASLARASPYEWNAKVSAQRRSVESGTRYNEWNVGLERTLRLPGKARADRDIAAATIDEGEARYGQALHETARELLDLWLNWTSAEQAVLLAVSQVKAAKDNAESVEKRVKAGDAAKLDAGITRAELGEQQRIASDARTAANVAWARLHSRFPDLPRRFSAVPEPMAIEGESERLHARIIDQSDELKIGEALFSKAQAQTARSRANRIPDPTVGVFTASEVGGRERLTGVMLSIPIPGAIRKGHADRSLQAAEVSRQEFEKAKRQVDATTSATLASASGAYESWQIAEQSATAMRDNGQLMQRAYTLGEADLQALLTARRQAATATHSALTTKVAATRAYYALLVDAHLVWDMGHE
jgi:cobalt-zinc-cadmium efflux system outer membrane protein